MARDPRTQICTHAFSAGEYSAERMKELQKNTVQLPGGPPAPEEEASAPSGAFKLSGSFKPAGAFSQVVKPAHACSLKPGALVSLDSHLTPADHR